MNCYWVGAVPELYSARGTPKSTVKGPLTSLRLAVVYVRFERYEFSASR